MKHEAQGVRLPSSGWDGVHIERARGVEHSHLDERGCFSLALMFQGQFWGHYRTLQLIWPLMVHWSTILEKREDNTFFEDLFLKQGQIQHKLWPIQTFTACQDSCKLSRQLQTGNTVAD